MNPTLYIYIYTYVYECLHWPPFSALTVCECPRNFGKRSFTWKYCLFTVHPSRWLGHRGCLDCWFILVEIQIYAVEFSNTGRLSKDLYFQVFSGDLYKVLLYVSLSALKLLPVSGLLFDTGNILLITVGPLKNVPVFFCYKYQWFPPPTCAAGYLY